MSEIDRLNSKLAKLKHGEIATEQTVAGGTEGIISVLLAEIEETILPREMVLTDETGAEFHLLVAGRRLLRVGNVAQSGGDDPAGAVAAAFNGTFRAFLDNAREISIAAGRPHERLDPSEIGCSVEALAAAVAKGPESVAEPQSVSDPVSACLALARAGLRLSDDGSAAPVGDADLVVRLLQFAETGLPALEPGRSGPRLTVLRAARAGDLVLAHIVADDAAALIFAPETARAQLLSICRRAL